MALKPPLNVVLGAGNVGDRSKDSMVRFDTPEEVADFLDAFHDRGGRQLDTARAYSPHAWGSSEPRLGAANAGDRFAIDTKVNSHGTGCHAKDKIEENINTSLAELKIPQIEIQYLHSPDRTTPFEETLQALHKAYTEGKFKRFGLSNYTAKEVETILRICEEREFVKPSVYQGQYNPIVRGAEKELLPLLRKHGVAFYAWSPAGAGFFAGNHKNVTPGGRYDTSLRIGQIYASFYLKPEIQAATDRVLEVAAQHGISGHAAALRWTVYHGDLAAEYGDSVIIGASSVNQMHSNLDMIEEGPLPQQVVDALGALYGEILGSEIAYHF